MFDFTVRARSGHWVLQDAEAGDLGAYDTRDEALAAASDWVRSNRAIGSIPKTSKAKRLASSSRVSRSMT